METKIINSAQYIITPSENEDCRQFTYVSGKGSVTINNVKIDSENISDVIYKNDNGLYDCVFDAEQDFQFKDDEFTYTYNLNNSENEQVSIKKSETQLRSLQPNRNLEPDFPIIDPDYPDHPTEIHRTIRLFADDVVFDFEFLKPSLLFYYVSGTGSVIINQKTLSNVQTSISAQKTNGKYIFNFSGVTSNQFTIESQDLSGYNYRYDGILVSKFIITYNKSVTPGFDTPQDISLNITELSYTFNSFKSPITFFYNNGTGIVKINNTEIDDTFVFTSGYKVNQLNGKYTIDFSQATSNFSIKTEDLSYTSTAIYNGQRIKTLTLNYIKTNIQEELIELTKYLSDSDFEVDETLTTGYPVYKEQIITPLSCTFYHDSGDNKMYVMGLNDRWLQISNTFSPIGTRRNVGYILSNQNIYGTSQEATFHTQEFTYSDNVIDPSSGKHVKKITYIYTKSGSIAPTPTEMIDLVWPISSSSYTETRLSKTIRLCFNYIKGYGYITINDYSLLSNTSPVEYSTISVNDEYVIDFSRVSSKTFEFITDDISKYKNIYVDSSAGKNYIIRTIKYVYTDPNWTAVPPSKQNFDVSTRKTQILANSSTTVTYISGSGTAYINSKYVNSDLTSTTVEPSDGYLLIYFDTDTDFTINVGGTNVTYTPKEVTFSPQDYKRVNMMIDDDTSYALLRVNPKLTGNIKVVIDSNSDLYLDTFKVSLGLSQNKYRHIPINSDEYYGRTLMAKMKSMPKNDLYNIEDSCYDLFSIANDFNDQYYDVYNSGVRTNNDKMYKENYAMLAPLCIRKNLPDFFLIFKIKNYEDLFKYNSSGSCVFDSSTIQPQFNNIADFINLNRCELIKSFDLREDSKIGKYIRNILKNNTSNVGDVFTGYDYNHFNVFNGISLDKGVVTSISEETSHERFINNQVSMNDWYTLGFERNHMVVKDIINFEFMFDDVEEPLFSIPTYFGLYVRLNGEDNTFSCISASGTNSFDSNDITGIGNHGKIKFNPASYPNIIYGVSTKNSFIRLNTNIKDAEQIKQFALKPYNSIISLDANSVNNYNDVDFSKSMSYVSVKLNEPLDPGEHYRIINSSPSSYINIYEVIVSNVFDENKELSEISYDTYTGYTKEIRIQRISILNTDYRSNVDSSEKENTIKRHISLLSKAFNSFEDNTIYKAYNDNIDSFSVVLSTTSTCYFEKISSICGFNNDNKNIINSDNYKDISSYLFGRDQTSLNCKMILKSSEIVNVVSASFYPLGFESLGDRVGYVVIFRPITYSSSNYNILISSDIDKPLVSYNTVIYNDESNHSIYYKLDKKSSFRYVVRNGNTFTILTAAPDYCIAGFGPYKNYLMNVSNKPFINNNGKLQLYQNYQLNHGVCSLLPLKDYYFDVLDNKSIFFIDDSDGKILKDTYASEYSDPSINVEHKTIISKPEECISDYIDKFETYNEPSRDDFDGYMTLDNYSSLGKFLNLMQTKGHTKLDITLMSPYCCKWKLLGTDCKGNRMRVMYDLNNSYFDIVKSSTFKPGIIINGVLSDSGVYRSEYTTTDFIDVSKYKDLEIHGKYPYAIFYYKNRFTLNPIVQKPDTTEAEKPTDKTVVFDSFYESNIIKNSTLIRITFKNNELDDFSDVYIKINKSYGDTPYLDEKYSSYWIQDNSDGHVGFLSSYHPNDDDYLKEYSKYISCIYDEETTGSFSDYIYSGEGSIEDLLYCNKNYKNKFSKVYKYGDNAIEFVSCGVKIRILSHDKSILNLYKYIGYSSILICMSGNNSKKPGTYEIFVDEIKEQFAVIIYNGLEYRYMRESVGSDGIFRICHSCSLSDIQYGGSSGKVHISDDGFLSDLSDDPSYLSGCKMFLISKPNNGENIELDNQITVTGNIDSISRDGKDITLINCKYSILNASGSIDSDTIINRLTNRTNNVDAYIELSEYAARDISGKTLTLEELRSDTKNYSITVKTKNGTSSYSNIENILDIEFVNKFYLERENKNYEVITSGYVHPSYAVPVMKDIFEFDYTSTAIKNISNSFEKYLNGCNIILNNVNSISQTWMKKVDNKNITKSVDSSVESETEIINKNFSALQTGIIDSDIDSSRYISPLEPGEILYEDASAATRKDNLTDSDITYLVNKSEKGDYDERTKIVYRTKDYELFINPTEFIKYNYDHTINEASSFITWKSFDSNDKVLHTLKITDNKIDSSISDVVENDIIINEEPINTYSFGFEIGDTYGIGNNDTEILNDVTEETFYYMASIAYGYLDASSNTNILKGLSYDDEIVAYKKVKDSSTFKPGPADSGLIFFFDGLVDADVNVKELRMRYIGKLNPQDMPKLNDYCFTLPSISNPKRTDCVWFDTDLISNFSKESKSTLIHFTVNRKNKRSSKQYLNSNLWLTSRNNKASLIPPEYSPYIILYDKDANEIRLINVVEANDYSVSTTNTFKNIKQSSSITLIRNLNPLVSYWYTNMCRVFKTYDYFDSFFGTFSGYEKNKFLASRGICLKYMDENDNISNTISIENWQDSIIGDNSVELNVTSSLITIISTSAGYNQSWSVKDRVFKGIFDNYKDYKTKYIENTILGLIDIKNDNKFILYVDKSYDKFEFINSKPDDSDIYEEVQNFSNELVFENNRYYMRINHLGNYRYYAKMIINL